MTGFHKHNNISRSKCDGEGNGISAALSRGYSAFINMRLFRLRIVRYISYAMLTCVFVFLFLLWHTPSTGIAIGDGSVVGNVQTIQTLQALRRMTDPDLNIFLRKINCRKLFDGDANEMMRAQNFVTGNQNFTHKPDLEFKTLFQNCAKYKLRRGYITQPMSDTEKDFPLAYNILFYKNVEQLERLLRAIYRPQNQYCIHIDQKTPDSIIETVRQLTNCFDNVFIASKLEIVVYASYTRLKADINCMRDHIVRGFDWKYLINMAASEFPIMTNHQMVQVFKEFKGANDIHEVFSTMDIGRFKKRYYTHLDERAKTGYMVRSKDVKDDPPHNLTITKGNAYNVFSIDFVRFVLSNKIAHDLFDWSTDTYTPDEHYWATLNNIYSNPDLNTPGGCKAHPDKKPYFGRYIGWKSNLARCQSRYYIHNICVFGVRDLPLLKERQEIIANKFDIVYDPVVYMCMEEWLHNKTINVEDITYRNYYQKLALLQK